MTFKTLALGETFTFQSGTVTHQRVLHCWKVSPRSYAMVLSDGAIRTEHIAHGHTPVYQHGLTNSVYVQG
jgi:hypothetical protein